MPLAPNAWTPIAYRPRSVLHGLLRWTEIPNAGIRLSAAQVLASEGKLLMANRHEKDTVFLVVRPLAQPVAENL